MARYGRLPEEFGENALGLYMNLDALDARDQMNTAAAIGAALSGSPEALGGLVYAATGDGALAQRTHIESWLASAQARGVSRA